MPTQIILCADDFALTPAVSRGILRLVEAGRISAVGCMTNRPSWPRDAARLLPYRDRVGIGLHLNLTLGAPLGPMPRIAPGGRQPPFGRVALKALLRRLSRAELAAEISRQVDAFIEATGTAPDFVDGHQHVHVLPRVRDALLDVLDLRGCRGRLWLRDPAEPVARIVARGVAVPKAMVISALAAGFGALARRRGYATNRGFSGVSPFDPDRDFGADMERFVDRPGPAHLVMCHPGELDEELRTLDPVVETRVGELNYLASDRFADLLSARDTVLVRRPNEKGASEGAP